MRFNLQTKIVSITITILFFAISALTLMSTRIFTKEYSSVLQTNGFIMGRNLKLQLDRLLRLGIPLEDLVGFEEQCESVVAEYKDISYAMVVNLNGEILFHSDSSQQSKKITDPTTLEAIREHKENVHTSLINGEQYQVIITPIFSPHGGHLAAVSIGFPTKVITKATASLVNYSVGIASISFVAAISLLVFALSLWVTNPLKSLMKAIQQIREKGLLATKVKVNTQDEIGQLASTFNKMTEDLQKTTTSIYNLNKEIDERKRAEEELRKAYIELNNARAQLIQAEKMGAIGQLAAGVAHEINNPLNVISGNAELLSMESRNRKVKKVTGIIMQQVKHAATITDRLLKFSRPKESKRMQVNINQILEEALYLLGSQAEWKNIKIIKQLSSALPQLRGDFVQLQEVFLNIILNAVQAMPKGGRLTLRTFTREITVFGKRKTDIFKQGEKIVVIEIKDTGEGMPEEKLKVVFDPFFTTKEQGTGLGLSICHGIIEAHQGTIEAQSKVGKGTTFIVKLPVQTDKGA